MRARAARWWLGALLLAVPLAGCGGQADTVVTNHSPGVYRFYCTFHASKEAKDGMVATLVVGDVPFDPGTAQRGTGLAPVAKASGTTRRVPEHYRTIQKAVDAAKPGDLVLVGPGVYREEVKVRTPSLVIWAIRAFRAAATGRGGAGR